MENNCWVTKKNIKNRNHKHTPDDMIDDDGVRVLKEAGKFHGDIRKSHPGAAKNLQDYSSSVQFHDSA